MEGYSLFGCSSFQLQFLDFGLQQLDLILLPLLSVLRLMFPLDDTNISI